MSSEFLSPITIISFDRPHYLERVCASLKAQRDFKFREDRVILAQDGAVSAITGRKAAREEDIEACVQVFRKYFPNGQILDYANNLGIAFNIRRAEQHVFETMDAPFGYFFEDDLELSPLYLSMMEEMRRSFRPEMRVAYWSAYGNHRQALAGPNVNLILMEHLWGFGLFRDAWREIMKEMEQYFSIISGRDYVYRPLITLFGLMKSREYALESTSQDAFRALALAKLGYARVMTDVCFGRYIGEEGAHFSPTIFKERGFDRMRAVTEGKFSLAPVTHQVIQAARAHGEEVMRLYRQQKFDKMWEFLNQNHYDEDRLVTLQEVEDLFRLLTDERRAAPSSLVDCVGKTSIHDLRGRLLNDFDVIFRNPPANRQRIGKVLSNKVPEQPLSLSPVTREDVIAAYRLILGRNPENEAVIGTHLGHANVSVLRDVFINSREFKETFGSR